MQIYLHRSPKASWLLEFSFNGKKFYSINDKNVVRLPPYDPLREKLSRAPRGHRNFRRPILQVNADLGHNYHIEDSCINLLKKGE